MHLRLLRCADLADVFGSIVSSLRGPPYRAPFAITEGVFESAVAEIDEVHIHISSIGKRASKRGSSDLRAQTFSTSLPTGKGESGRETTSLPSLR